jgi:hypothetical protein
MSKLVDMCGRELDVNQLVLVASHFGRLDIGRIKGLHDAGVDSQFDVVCVRERLDDEPEIYNVIRYPEALVAIEATLLADKNRDLVDKWLKL